MTATDCEHVWVRILGGGLQCSECGATLGREDGTCPITACRRALDDHIGWTVPLDHPVCPGDMPLPPPCGPAHRKKRK